MSEIDPLEAELMRGAAAALRNRAKRQAKIAAEGTTFGDRGVAIRSGEAAIASTLIGNTAKAIETNEFAERLAKLEAQAASKGNP
jgi:hypothetical protein